MAPNRKTKNPSGTNKEQKKPEKPNKTSVRKVGSHLSKRDETVEEPDGSLCSPDSIINHSDLRRSLMSTNVLKHIIQQENGNGMKHSSAIATKVLKQQVVQSVKSLAVSKVIAPFDCRITALAWHPSLVTTLAASSKWGDIVLWNHDHISHNLVVKGSGPGATITCIKFDVHARNHLYCCSLDGIVCRRDLDSGVMSECLNIGGRLFTDWYTSLDVSSINALVMAGDNRGNVNLVTKNGELVWSKRLHQGKVHDVAFHTLDSSLFVTASVDNYMRLWDLRNISDKKSCLVEMEHQKGVNSACFSPCHGTRLLTTDQHSELKIFSGPLWNLETNILHPHRQFQHLTAFRADWHPLEDIVVVGRYPDPKFPGSDGSEPRSVDFFDASDGKLLCQIEPSYRNGLMSLNKFDHVGRVLASAMGHHIVLWKPKSLEASIPKENRVKDLFLSAAEMRKRRHDRDEEDGNADLKKRKKCTTGTSLKTTNRKKSSN